MKRRAWKWVLGILGGLAVAVGALVASLHLQASAVFERHDEMVKKEFAAIRARPGVHPVLFEPELPGDGWPPLEKALEGFAAIPDADAEELPSIRGDEQFQADPEKLDAIFEKYSPLVEKLRRANRHRGFNPVYRLEEGAQLQLKTSSDAIRTCRFLGDRALRSQEKYEDAKALESILLGLAVADDIGRSGPLVNSLIQYVCEGIVIQMAREMFAGHSFDGGDLKTFAANLDRLWGVRPDLDRAWAVEDAVTRRTLVDLGQGTVDPKRIGLGSSSRSWRYLFSRRLVAAGALGEFEKRYRDVRSVSSMAPHLRESAARALVTGEQESKNPIVLDSFPMVTRAYGYDADARLRWTMLRVATAIALCEADRGTTPARLQDLVPVYLSAIPSCPSTGAPLGYCDGRVWSVGHNGLDDGGVPGTLNDIDDRDGDYVWMVRRE